MRKLQLVNGPKTVACDRVIVKANSLSRCCSEDAGVVELVDTRDMKNDPDENASD